MRWEGAKERCQGWTPLVPLLQPHRHLIREGPALLCEAKPLTCTTQRRQSVLEVTKLEGRPSEVYLLLFSDHVVICEPCPKAEPNNAKCREKLFPTHVLPLAAGRVAFIDRGPRTLAIKEQSFAAAVSATTTPTASDGQSMGKSRGASIAGDGSAGDGDQLLARGRPAMIVGIHRSVGKGGKGGKGGKVFDVRFLDDNSIEEGVPAGLVKVAKRTKDRTQGVDSAAIGAVDAAKEDTKEEKENKEEMASPRLETTVNTFTLEWRRNQPYVWTARRCTSRECEHEVGSAGCTGERGGGSLL